MSQTNNYNPDKETVQRRAREQAGFSREVKNHTKYVEIHGDLPEDKRMELTMESFHHLGIPKDKKPKFNALPDIA